MRSNPGRVKITLRPPFLIHTRLFEDKQVVHDQVLAVRARYLGNLHHLARSAGKTGGLHDDVNGRGDLLAQGGIAISQGASVTLTPGIYILDGGGLTVTGSSSLEVVSGNTSGVMIYNNWQSSSDAISLKGTGSLLLAPPSSGAYQGLTIFQKRGTLGNPAPALTILGSGNVNITGTIYVAYSTVTLEGVSGINNVGGQIVADTVNASGRGTMNVNAGGQPTANARTLGLVE
jgi:hypothetical protein